LLALIYEQLENRKELSASVFRIKQITSQLYMHWWALRSKAMCPFETFVFTSRHVLTPHKTCIMISITAGIISR